MRRLALALPLLVAGCAPAAWQSGLETAGVIVDTAAVVRARRLGLCGAASAPVATPEDVAARQAEIARLQRELDDVQRQLTEVLVEMAKRGAVSPPPSAPP